MIFFFFSFFFNADLLHTFLCEYLKRVVFKNWSISIFFTFQLLQLAIRFGDKHTPTMEMADFWLMARYNLDLMNRIASRFFIQ